MKFIDKDIINEPESLRVYRNTTPNATYKGFGNTSDVRLALLNEQGYICAYCMKRISLELNDYYKPQIEIEHYKSQENFQDEGLNYMNMLGVCNGTVRKESEFVGHCDKSRKFIENGKTHSWEFQKLNPTKKHLSESLISYDLNGKIKSVNNNKEVENDLNEFLNLNNKYLIEYRRDALDRARKLFEKNNPKKADKRWNKKMFDKEIEKYKSRDKKGMYKPFCQYIIWYFEFIKTKNKYLTKE